MNFVGTSYEGKRSQALKCMFDCALVMCRALTQELMNVEFGGCWPRWAGTFSLLLARDFCHMLMVTIGECGASTFPLPLSPSLLMRIDEIGCRGRAQRSLEVNDIEVDALNRRMVDNVERSLFFSTKAQRDEFASLIAKISSSNAAAS